MIVGSFGFHHQSWSCPYCLGLVSLEIKTVEDTWWLMRHSIQDLLSLPAGSHHTCISYQLCVCVADTDLCPCGETQTMSHIVESCPLTKLNGGLSRLHSADENAVSWLTNYGKWHAYEKKKKKLPATGSLKTMPHPETVSRQYFHHIGLASVLGPSILVLKITISVLVLALAVLVPSLIFVF